MKQLIAYTENGKWGYKDKENNKILIPAKYDEIDPSIEKLTVPRFPVVYDKVRLKLNGKWGVYSITNEEILPFLYDEIESRSNFFFVKINDKYGIVDLEGEIVIPFIYDEIVSGFSMILVRQKDKWGALDEDGQEVLPVVFDKIKDNIFAPCFEVTLGGKKGIVTYNGNIIVPPDYEDVYTFDSYDTFGIKKDGKWQIVDRKNQPKNSQFYDEFKEGFESSIIAVRKDKKWGFIYKDGQEAYPVSIEEVKGNNPFFQIKIQNKWGVLNTLGWKVEEALPIKYEKIVEEKLNLRKQEENGKFGVVDHTGKIIVPIIYDTVDNFCCNYAKKIIGKKEGANDDIYMPPQYIEVSKDGKRGIFDVLGNEKVPVKYDMFEFNYDHNDLIPTYINGKWGYINIDNEVIVPFIYDYASYFDEHFANVVIGDKCGLIDRKGNLVFPFEYDEIITLGSGMIRVFQNGKSFEMETDSTGKIIERYDKNSLVHITTFLKEMGIELNQIIYEGGDGSSVENAIIIKNATTTHDGIEAEYTWIEKKHGEYNTIKQSTKALNDKWYDIITVRLLSDNKIVKIFFDITDFYGMEFRVSKY